MTTLEASSALRHCLWLLLMRALRLRRRQRGAILRTGLGRGAKPCASTGPRDARLEVWRVEGIASQPRWCESKGVLSRGFERSKVKLGLVMDQSEFEVVQPALASEYIAAESGVIGEVDNRFYTLIQDFDADSVTVSIDGPTPCWCYLNWLSCFKSRPRSSAYSLWNIQYPAPVST